MRGNGLVWLVGALAAVLLAGSVYWGVQGVRGVSELAAGARSTPVPAAGEAEAVREVAAAAAVAQATFDYRRPDDRNRALAELAAGPLRESLLAAPPDSQGVRWRLVTAGEAREVEVLEVAGASARARAVVRVTIQGLAPAGDASFTTQVDRTLLLRLRRTEAGWRVVELEVEGEQAVPPAPAGQG
ncbi:MAG TPA: hypothetical protein VIO14_06985 [Dehalococcoidia bacterium]